MNKSSLFLILFLMIAVSVQGQKPKSNQRSRVYHFEETEKNIEIAIDFPFPYKVKTEDKPSGRIYFVSAEDTTEKTTYILNYTRHLTPLGRISPQMLAETTFETFLIASESEVLKKSETDWKGNPGIHAQTANKSKGMLYEYRTFMDGNIQIQIMIARPATKKSKEKDKLFFNSFQIK